MDKTIPRSAGPLAWRAAAESSVYAAQSCQVQMGNSTSSVSSMWLYLQLKKEIVQICFLPSSRNAQVCLSTWLTLNFHWVSERFYVPRCGLLDGVCKIISNSQEDIQRELLQRHHTTAGNNSWIVQIPQPKLTPIPQITPDSTVFVYVAFLPQPTINHWTGTSICIYQALHTAMPKVCFQQGVIFIHPPQTLLPPPQAMLTCLSTYPFLPGTPCQLLMEWKNQNDEKVPRL